MAKRKLTKPGSFPAGALTEPGDADVRQRILSAAEERFRAQGYQRMCMDDLATDLGMSKKTIYKHFPRKDLLMLAIARQAMGTIERQVGEIASSDRPFIEKITTILPLIGRQYVRLTKTLRTDLTRYAPAIWKEIETFRRLQATTKVYPMLKSARAEGVLRPDVSPELFFLTFLTAVEGILNPYTLANEPYSADEAFAGIFRILFQGALTEEASAQFSSKFTAESLLASVRVE